MARRNFCSAFEGFELTGISAQTGDAYFALAKLAFAFSALELLESLLDSGRKVQVLDPVFRTALLQGKFDDLVHHLSDLAAQQVSKRSKGKVTRDQSIDAFLGPDKPIDLVPIIRHARHVVFHSTITPNTVGLQASRRRRELLEALAESTLSATDAEFANWLLRVHRQRS